MRVLLAGLILFVSALPANATMFRIDYSADIDLIGSVLALPAGSIQPFTLSFIVDTEAAPVLYASAGTLVGGMEATAIPALTDLYGFSASAISDVSATLGGESLPDLLFWISSFGKTWPEGSPLSGAFFVDHELVSGGNYPNLLASAYWGDTVTSGFFNLGGQAWSATSSIYAHAQVTQDLPYRADTAYVVGTAATRVTVVPLPAAIWLLLSGVLVLFGVGYGARGRELRSWGAARRRPLRVDRSSRRFYPRTSALAAPRHSNA
jgi:hypothetical protein